MKTTDSRNYITHDLNGLLRTNTWLLRIGVFVFAMCLTGLVLASNPTSSKPEKLQYGRPTGGRLVVATGATLTKGSPLWVYKTCVLAYFGLL